MLTLHALLNEFNKTQKNPYLDTHQFKLLKYILSVLFGLIVAAFIAVFIASVYKNREWETYISYSLMFFNITIVLIAFYIDKKIRTFKKHSNFEAIGFHFLKEYTAKDKLNEEKLNIINSLIDEEVKSLERAKPMVQFRAIVFLLTLMTGATFAKLINLLQLNSSVGEFAAVTSTVIALFILYIFFFGAFKDIYFSKMEVKLRAHERLKKNVLMYLLNN